MFRRIYGYILTRTAKRGYWGDWYYKERYLKVLKSLLRFCKHDGFIILDVGCGLGIYGKLLSKYYLKFFYVGLDINKKTLTSANRGHNINYIMCDAQKLPILKSSVEISLCSEILEHLSSPYKALADICEVTKNAIIITFPEEKLLSIFRDRHPEHISEINERIILRTLKSKGFKIIGVHQIFTSFIPCGIPEFLNIPRNFYIENMLKAIDRVLKKIIPSRFAPHKTILIEAKRKDLKQNGQTHSFIIRRKVTST
ncbi:MAG: class I SAM-dependent methyltransferase [Candidatus Bathyarchaeia archaeon]